MILIYFILILVGLIFIYKNKLIKENFGNKICVCMWYAFCYFPLKITPEMF